MRSVSRPWVKLMRGCALLGLVLVCCTALSPVGISAQKPTKPLAKNEVIDLLKNGVPSTRLETLVRQYGISFQMTHVVSNELREAGASDALMKTLWQLSAKGTPPAATPTTPGTAQPPTPASAPPVLQIEVNPGGAQVYVDDALMGSTSSQGRLILSQLPSGQHQVRLSLPGYRDYEQNVTLAAGQTVNMAATLEAVKPAVSTPATSTPPTPAQPRLQPPPPNVPMETFYVAHDHGKGGQTYCMGWLSVGSGKVEFRSTTEPSHSFSYPLTMLKDYGPNDFYMVELGGFHVKAKVAGKKDQIYNFVAVSSTGQFLPPLAMTKAFRRALGRTP